MLFRGVTRGVGLVTPPRAAESKWRQGGRQNEYYRSVVPKLSGDPWVYICNGEFEVSLLL